MNFPALSRQLLLAGVVAAAAAAPRPASAQPTRTDTAEVLLAAAEDFVNRGADDIAEAVYRHILERFPGTAAAETARSLLGSVATRRSRGGGEVELKVWSTLYGIWLGLAIPWATGSDDPEGYGFGLVFGGPVGFLVGREMAHARPRTLGQARAITWGGTWGIIQGFGWGHALDLGGSEATYHDESTEGVVTAMIVGGTAGIAAGLAAARREITPGTATSAMLGSLWGLWFGFSTAYLADVEGDGLMAAAMIGGDAGLVAGALAGSRVPLGRGRARMISVAGLIGAAGGAGLVLIAKLDTGEGAVGTILAGSVLGLVAGAASTGGDLGDFDRSEAPEAGASLFAPGALVNRSKGGWTLSPPLPTAARRPVPGNGGRDGLVWKVPLLKVRF